MSQSIQRAIEILEYVSVQPRTPSEVGAHFDIHRSTALRTLQTLTESGLTRRREDGRYGVGYRLAGLANLALDQFDLANIAHPYLQELGRRCGHTVHLAAVQGRSIVYADKIEQPGMVRLYSQIGHPVTIHTSGVVKAILAYQAPEFVEHVLSSVDFSRYTATTITSREQFLEQLAQVVERGYAVDDGEYEDFLHCVAMPLRDATGQVTGAVSITALKARATMDDLVDLLPALRTTTTTISKELGWRP
jgi:DNA-binding IclR family transcriptional regulator